jgi:hypothetical protein
LHPAGQAPARDASRDAVLSGNPVKSSGGQP